MMQGVELTESHDDNARFVAAQVRPFAKHAGMDDETLGRVDEAVAEGYARLTDACAQWEGASQDLKKGKASLIWNAAKSAVMGRRSDHFEERYVTGQVGQAMVYREALRLRQNLNDILGDDRAELSQKLLGKTIAFTLTLLRNPPNVGKQTDDSFDFLHDLDAPNLLIDRPSGLGMVAAVSQLREVE